jgi:RecB family exonuclease
MSIRSFPTSAALHDHLLHEADPGSLVIVPHQRLARQVWDRQRRRELAAGRRAWEPLPVITLQGWLHHLFQSLWPPLRMTPYLQRLALWVRALESGPPLEGAGPTLEWAQTLDEAYLILCRHSLIPIQSRPTDPPMVAWRRQITRLFREQLAREGLITQGGLPVYLIRALEGGLFKLPETVYVAGFKTPAPADEAWFKAAATRTRMVFLEVEGSEGVIQKAAALPDRRREVEWVAGEVIRAAAEGASLHRLAVTSPEMDLYGPMLRRALGELLGQARTEAGYAYNISQGPALADFPLFQAALLPLLFLTRGQRREDLVSLLLSPYYRALETHQTALARWDRLFRERRAERGWERLRQAALQSEPAPELLNILKLLDKAFAFLGGGRAVGREWARRLRETWKRLGFPGGLNSEETAAWNRLTGLLTELAPVMANPVDGGEFLEWLTLGARTEILPGAGVQEAGIQVLGHLEMRGLDFDWVYCLGMNSGAFPAPPRALPLLSAEERAQVLGGTHASQQRFAREVFNALLGTAPRIILTRPQVVDEEERPATPLYPGEWNTVDLNILSRPDRAWLRAPAVQAALRFPETGPAPDAAIPFTVPVPSQVSITQAGIALACPCRFLLEILLKIENLPEIAPGLNPRERGTALHRILARFVAEFKKKILDEAGLWDTETHREAMELLGAAARKILAGSLPDLHWQAEWERLLDEEAGLLWEWLELERERFAQGWRWLHMEAGFEGLKGKDWPFALKGRIDRIDHHPENRELVVWDYKSGEIPRAREVFDEPEDFQLPAYLLALIHDQVPAPEAEERRAGYIGLKSVRSKHLKHEEFPKKAGLWEQVLAVWEERLANLRSLLDAGDFRPDPTPLPGAKDKGACKYCSYTLVCGFVPQVAGEEEGEEGDA